jgi:hypothetical protein
MSENRASPGAGAAINEDGCLGGLSRLPERSRILLLLEPEVPSGAGTADKQDPALLGRIC